MWNPFRKKTLQLPPTPPPNRVDELANALQREGRIGEVEHELEKFDQLKLSQAELESWWHIYGIAAFQAGRQEEATARFEEAYRRFPKSPHIRFSLGQQYVNARQMDRGFELFRSCVFPEIPSDYVMAQVRYAYLWNRYDDGRQMLRPFFKAFQELKILDDHFLYVRGLPFFGAWWSYLAALSMLKGRNAASQGEADALLDSVTLKENDFPWLADIRTLAKAEIARRFSNSEAENQHIDALMAKQAMLFEPDIALNFHLLRYQEHLKPRFQSK